MLVRDLSSNYKGTRVKHLVVARQCESQTGDCRHCACCKKRLFKWKQYAARSDDEEIYLDS